MALEGSDVVAMARTGSGKTLAFVVPVVQRITSTPTNTAGIRALILSPTRELSQQTYKYAKGLTAGSGVKVALLTGGDNIEEQFHQLAANPEIVIATPGRLLHLIHETGMTLKTLEILVFDEADRLLEMGFQAEIEAIVKEANHNRQTLLFSATLPKLLAEFTKVGLRNPVVIRLDAETQLSENLLVAFFTVRTEEKQAALVTLLQEVVKPEEQTIVFAATRHHVDYLHEVLTKHNITSTTIYGQMDASARKYNLNKFVKKAVRVLLVTDVAARGIDIPQLDVVINYDFPCKPKLFVHRVGRTARAGKSGSAYSLLQLDELPYLLDLQLFLNATKVQNELQGMENCVNGRFPSAYLGITSEQILKHRNSDPSIEALHRSMGNATKLYKTNRTAPSPSSVERSKELLGMKGLLALKVHPLVAHLGSESEQALEEFVQENLKAFRPSQTVFEYRNPNPTNTAMFEKRRMYENSIKKKRDSEKLKEQMEAVEALEDEGVNIKKRKSISDGDESTLELNLKKPKVFKDEKYFLKNMATTHHFEKGLTIDDNKNKGIEDLILDLQPDDDRSIFRKRSQMQWNAKKRNFVNVEDPTKKLFVKNEAGQMVLSGSSGGKLYKTWSEKTHKKIPIAGQSNSNHEMPDISFYKHKNNKANQKDSNVKNEIKSKDQLRKMKEQEEKERRKKEMIEKKKNPNGDKRKGFSGGNKKTSMGGGDKRKGFSGGSKKTSMGGGDKRKGFSGGDKKKFSSKKR